MRLSGIKISGYSWNEFRLNSMSHMKLSGTAIVSSHGVCFI
jgi:hypothetical protein